MIPLFKDTTSGQKQTHLLRLAVTFNGYTFNDPADPVDDGVELTDALVVPMVDSVTEAKQGRDGTESFQVFKSGLTIRLRGYIKKPTLVELYAEAQAMALATDPAHLSRISATSTVGFLPLYFSVPTADTANYPTGMVSSFYQARPIQPVSFGRTKYDGYQMPFTLDFFVKDPRRYFITEQSGNSTLDNTLATYPSPARTVITRPSGVASANYGVRNMDAVGGPFTIQLDLSSTIVGDIIEIDHERRVVKLNGQSYMPFYQSGEYWQVEPGIVNDIETDSGAGCITTTYWYRAFVL